MKKLFIALCSALMVVSTSLFVVGCGKDNNTPNSSGPDSSIDQETETGLGETLYTINIDINDRPKYMLVSSLQGILAQKGKASIYITTYGDSNDVRKYIESNYGQKFVEVNDEWELIEKFKSEIKDAGYVLYDADTKSVNGATTVAGIENYLMIDVSLEEKAISKGLTKKFDMVQIQTECDQNADNSDKKIFDMYKDRLNKSKILFQTPNKIALRDYAIANKLFAFYVADSYGELDKAFKQEVYSWADPNAPVLGFCDDYNDSKYDFITEMNLFGKYNITNDFMENVSMLSLFDEIDNSEIKQNNYKKETVKGTSGKHYLTLVMSEGNNMTWQSNGFANNELYYNYDYKNDVPVNFGISPSFVDYAPTIMRDIYSKAGSKQYFMSGVSGAGYVDIASYSEDCMDAYLDKTNDLMKEADLNYVNLLDSHILEDGRPFYLESLAKRDGIDGGIISTPGNYAEANGSIYWAEGKPFVAARELLWNENYKKVAYRINNYVKDYTAIEGYTVLEFYPFAVNAKTLLKFVESLDESIEIVNMDVFMDLIKENVAKEDVVTLNDKDKNNPSDFDDYPGIIDDYIDIDLILNDDKTAPTDQLVFGFDKEDEFKEFGVGNGDKQFDFVNYNQSVGNSKNGCVLYSGNDSGLKDAQGNSWIYRKIKIPDLDNLRLSVSYKLYVKGNDTDARIRVVYADPNDKKTPAKIDILSDWKTYSSVNDKWIVEEFDISKYKGMTVTFVFEQNDNGNSYNEFLCLDDIKIYSFSLDEEVYPMLSVGDLEKATLSEDVKWGAENFNQWNKVTSLDGTVSYDSSITLTAPKNAVAENTYAYVYNKVKVTDDVLRIVKSANSKINVSFILLENNNKRVDVKLAGKTDLDMNEVRISLLKYKGQSIIVIIKIAPEGENNSVQINSIELTKSQKVEGIEQLSKEEVIEMECQTKQDFTNEDHSYWGTKSIKGTSMSIGKEIMFEGVHGVSKPDGIPNQYAFVKVKIAETASTIEVLGRGHDFYGDGTKFTNGNWRIRILDTEDYSFTTVIDWKDIQVKENNEYTTLTGNIPEKLRGKEVLVIVESDSGLTPPANFAFDFSFLLGFKFV